MATPTPKPADLKGRRRGWWYVVDYAGQRNGVNYWQCICCRDGFRRVVAEPDIRDHKTNSLDLPCRCQEPLGDLTDHVYGLWTVIGPVGPRQARPVVGGVRLWKCRCACGACRVFTEKTLESRRMWSCGCRPEKEVRREWESKQRRAYNRVYGPRGSSQLTRSEREKQDRGWTAEMKEALYALQPRCLLCEESGNPNIHHVRPVSHGYGKRPGNAVRLCGACNRFIYDREPSQLTPRMAAILESGAAQFKEYWDGKCDATAVRTVTPVVARPKDPDPALVAILEAVEHGEDAAILALARWLEERRDPSATAIQKVLEDSLGPLARVFQWPGKTNEVWKRLGLSWSERAILTEHLGISAKRVSPSASRAKHAVAETQVQAARDRNKIDLAVHKLACPTANACGKSPHGE